MLPVLSTTLQSYKRARQTREHRKSGKDRCLGAQFGTAEKGGKGMALKIRARAESMPGGRDNFEIRTHTK